MSENYIVKASFAHCPLEERAKFKASKAVLLVSVGQIYHEGMKFQSTLDLASRKFKDYAIIVGDTLQRHNLSFRYKLTEKEALALSIKKGDEWLDRNAGVIKKYHRNCEIFRWSDYLESDEYSNAYKQINNLYAAAVGYKASVEQSISEYVGRLEGEAYSIAMLEELCSKYVKEECAGMLLWAKNGYNYEVYPRKRNPAMQFVWEHVIKPSHGNVLVPVALRFKKQKVKAEV